MVSVDVLGITYHRRHRDCFSQHYFLFEWFMKNISVGRLVVIYGAYYVLKVKQQLADSPTRFSCHKLREARCPNKTYMRIITAVGD